MSNRVGADRAYKRSLATCRKRVRCSIGVGVGGGVGGPSDQMVPIRTRRVQ